MNIYKRRIVAFVIGKLIGGKEISRVFDRTTSSYNEVAGEVSITSINVYDTEKNEMITGSGDDKGISLYDFVTAKFIDIKIYGEKFDGFDYESKKVFYGDMKENTVSFFDFQDSKHHYYIMLNPYENVTENLGLLI
ncbi:MAG: hypothetical protein A2V93_11660 [Ignavibacteria bacterium RBG_16_34_14]|nr:MAG: hypothetical protein A2V93_11660 [Ignavibacteria bacterium RBG_16_34_14]